MRTQLVSELPPSPVPVTRWSSEFLDGMRRVADPETDALALEVFQAGGPPALIRMTQLLEDWEAPIAAELPARMREWFAAPVDYPAFVDPAEIARRRGALRRLRPGLDSGAADVRGAAFLHQPGGRALVLPGRRSSARTRCATA